MKWTVVSTRYNVYHASPEVSIQHAGMLSQARVVVHLHLIAKFYLEQNSKMLRC